jgi:hypothetical protein
VSKIRSFQFDAPTRHYLTKKSAHFSAFDKAVIADLSQYRTAKAARIVSYAMSHVVSAVSPVKNPDAFLAATIETVGAVTEAYSRWVGIRTLPNRERAAYEAFRDWGVTMSNRRKSISGNARQKIFEYLLTENGVDFTRPKKSLNKKGVRRSVMPADVIVRKSDGTTLGIYVKTNPRERWAQDFKAGGAVDANYHVHLFVDGILPSENHRLASQEENMYTLSGDLSKISTVGPNNFKTISALIADLK